MARNWLESCSGLEFGLDQLLHLTVEDAYGENSTVEIPTDSDYIEHIAFNVQYARNREDSEARSGRSYAVRLDQKIDITWDSEFYLISADPTGAGTDEPGQPNIHNLLYGLFGSFDDTTSAQELKYEFVACNEISLRSYTLGTNYGQLGLGLVVNEGTFTFEGDGMAKAAFTGFGQTILDAQRATLDADTVSANDLVLQTGEGKRFDVGAYISVVNQSTGALIAEDVKITAITGDTLTVDGAAFSASTGDLVVPAELDASTSLTSDKALLGLEGSLSVDGTELDCVVQSAEISVNNNFTQRDNIYGTDKICGFLNDTRRDVNLSMELQMNTEVYEMFRKSKNQETMAIELKLSPNNGDAALGRTWTFDIPKFNADVPELTYEADGVVVISLEGRALATAAGSPNTEMTLTIGPV